MLTVNKRESQEKKKKKNTKRGATKKLSSTLSQLRLAGFGLPSGAGPPAMALEPFAGRICPLLLQKYSAATPKPAWYLLDSTASRYSVLVYLP